MTVVFEGKIEAIKYARTHKVPFLGLCLGMQLAIVEFARDVVGYHDAHSVELNPNTTHPVIHIMSDQIGIEDIGGTLRLGSYPCVLNKESKAYKLYGKEEIHERHRHRYEVNNDYRDALTQNGMLLSGLSPDGRIVEMVEIPEHPWFIGTQHIRNSNPVRTNHIRCLRDLWKLLWNIVKRTKIILFLLNKLPGSTIILLILELFLYSFFFSHFRIPYKHTTNKTGPNHFSIKRNVY